MRPAEARSDSVAIEDDGTGTSVKTLKRAIIDNLLYVVGKTTQTATRHDYFMAVAYTVRDRIIARWLNIIRSQELECGRVVAYLSAEHLLGPLLDSNLLNLGLEEPFSRATETGSMKFAMNGALTITTLDGANIELRDEAGAGNFFLFGLNVDEVKAIKKQGYRPADTYHSNASLRDVIDAIVSGQFSRGDRELFRPLLDSLLHTGEYLLFADYQSYIDCQDRVSEAYEDQDRWTRMAMLNVARTGKFSSDRSIREYCQSVWCLPV
jgi:glucan phosphorylase